MREKGHFNVKQHHPACCLMLSRTVAPPFPLSKVSANLLNKLGDVNLYINDEVLTYVITLPLVSRGKCEVIKLIPISIVLENKGFLYIDTEESILCLDQNRQYYMIIDQTEFYRCKTTTTVPYVCTQSYVVMCSDGQETRAVKLLEQRGNIVR